jgi:hypothetical protein
LQIETLIVPEAALAPGREPLHVPVPCHEGSGEARSPKWMTQMFQLQHVGLSCAIESLQCPTKNPYVRSASTQCSLRIQKVKYILCVLLVERSSHPHMPQYRSRDTRRYVFGCIVAARAVLFELSFARAGTRIVYCILLTR